MAHSLRALLLSALAGLLVADGVQKPIAPTFAPSSGGGGACIRARIEERPLEALASCAASSTSCGVTSPVEGPRAPKSVARRTPPRYSGRFAPYSAPPKSAPVCLDPPSWTIGLRPLAIPSPDARLLEGWVRFFAESKTGRGVVTTWLKRSGRYRHVVEQGLKNEHLPRDLVALVFVESGFSPRAVSSAGAVGLWQLMEHTARDLGLEVRPGYDERRSIERSTEAATRHLSELYAQFGSWELVFAAYDYGAKRLMQRMQSTGAMSFWDLAELGVLPDETVEYVPKVLAFATILKNLDRFGFDDVPLDPPLSTSDLDTPPGTSFGILARAAGTSVARIRELNPELVKNEVPDIGRWIPVHVPAGGLARARVMFATLLQQGKKPGIEDLVPDDFDWSKHSVPPSIASLAKPSGACGADPIAESQGAVAENRPKRQVEVPPKKRTVSKTSI